MVDGTFTVTGGKAGDGAPTTAGGPAKGGHGGYAGISVPNGTVLTICGAGTLSARGGDAGRGGDGKVNVNSDNGGAGGGGAGAGIGGNGGSGGNGMVRTAGGANSGLDGNPLTSGQPGLAGISAGSINIYENVKVNAYGGAGAAGGAYANSISGGAGGYPGAGVGGGGAGAGGSSHEPTGGGFNSGHNMGAVNVYINGTESGGYSHSGGSYYAVSHVNSTDYTSLSKIGGLPGITKSTYYHGATGGAGGSAGSGGQVKKANTATLDARNGSYLTANQRKWGQSPAPIYLQSGFKLDMIRGKGVTSVSARTGEALTQELKNKSVTQSVQPFSYDGKDIYGVGSGAGATETSNGSTTEHEGGDCCFLSRPIAKYMLY